MRATLKQIRVFEAVSRLGSVSAAASEVSITQSAASLALQQLERALDTVLFERKGKRLLLTANGRRLQPKARSVLAAAHDLADNNTDKLEGLISIGATNTISDYILPYLCSDFQLLHPDVQFKITSSIDRFVIEGVENIGFDIGFIESVALRQLLRTEPWLDDEAVVVAAASHWSVGRRVSVDDLKGVSWFLPPMGTPLRHAVAQELISFGRFPIETTSSEAIKRLVRLGKGVACVSRYAVTEELAKGELACLDVADFAPQRRFAIVTRRDVDQGVLQKTFAKYALAYRPTHP